MAPPLATAMNSSACSAWERSGVSGPTAFEMTMSTPPYWVCRSAASFATAAASVTSSLALHLCGSWTGCGCGDPFRVATGEQDQVGRIEPGGQTFGEGQAKTLIRPGDQGDCVSYSRLGAVTPMSQARHRHS